MVLNEKKANAQSITKQRTISDVRNGNLDMKKKRRSFVYRHQRMFSAENDFERSISKQKFDKSNSIDDAVNSNSSIVRKKVISEDLVGVEASMNSNREDEDSTLSAGGIKKNADSEVSPKVKAKPPGSACSTPLKCATTINVASPVCTGDDYHRDLGKKSLSRSSLWRELSKLDAIEAMPAPKYKESRKRKDMTNIRVLFSQHLDEDIIKQQKKILARQGVSVASSSSDSTHFVTDKFVRTRNMLEAIALGKPVVTPLWLESCGQASCFIDEKNYIMRDARKEKAIGFSMPVSLARACQRPLLQGQRVFVTPNVKPSKELIASLVKAVHGQAVERIGRSTMKDDKIPDDLLVLSCEEDYAICVPFLEKGATVYGSELLLNGIVIQKLEYERHRLFSDNVKRTRSTVWLRKEAGDCFLPVNKCK